VARQLGKVWLVACTELHIDMTRRQCTIGGIVLNEGDLISLDGDGGVVYPGQLAIVTERPDRSLAAIASWREARAV
jgi:pyruvate,orthophosphate dikinase